MYLETNICKNKTDWDLDNKLYNFSISDDLTTKMKTSKHSTKSNYTCLYEKKGKIDISYVNDSIFMYFL